MCSSYTTFSNETIEVRPSVFFFIHVYLSDLRFQDRTVANSHLLLPFITNISPIYFLLNQQEQNILSNLVVLRNGTVQTAWVQQNSRSSSVCIRISMPYLRKESYST